MSFSLPGIPSPHVPLCVTKVSGTDFPCGFSDKMNRCIREMNGERAIGEFAIARMPNLHCTERGVDWKDVRGSHATTRARITCGVDATESPNWSDAFHDRAEMVRHHKV